MASFRTPITPITPIPPILAAYSPKLYSLGATVPSRFLTK
jgi:hypothetical protein